MANAGILRNGRWQSRPSLAIAAMPVAESSLPLSVFPSVWRGLYTNPNS